MSSKVWVCGVIALILTWLSYPLAAYIGPRFQEIIGMQMVFPLVFLFFLMLIIIFCEGFIFLYNKVKGREQTIAVIYDEQEDERSDFYLKRKQGSNISIYYQLIKKQGEILWYGSCCFEQKTITAIEIFADGSDDCPVMKAIRSSGEVFSVYDQEFLSGYIAEEDMDIIFSNSDDKQILLAAKKEIKDEKAQAMDNILFLVDLTPSFNKNGNCYVLRGREGLVWGKYYVGLQNLELVEASAIDDFTMKLIVLIIIILDNRHNSLC